MTVYTNLFKDPRGTATTRFSSTATQTLSNVADMTGGIVSTALRTTRTAGGNVRLVDIRTDTTVPASTPIRLRMRVRSSVLLGNVDFIQRTSVTASGTGVALATLNIPAGYSDIDITGTTHATAPTSAAGIVLIHNGSTIGSTLDITEILIEEVPGCGRYFDGTLPDVGPFNYAWTSTVNDSTSTLTTVDEPEKTIPSPYGKTVASNSKATLRIKYRSGWAG